MQVFKKEYGIDEIQNSSQAVKMLRCFYEKHPDIFVVGAGSLLEIALEKEDISFSEFLEASEERSGCLIFHTILRVRSEKLPVIMYSKFSPCSYRTN